jgi:ABC-type multidrug transport system fused ATPase/permease subunit
LDVIRQLFGLFEGYRWAIPAAAVLGCVASLAEGLGIGLLIPLLEVALDADSSPAAASGPLIKHLSAYADDFDATTRTLVLILTIIVIVFVKSVIQYCDTLLSAWIHGRIAHDVRRRILGQVLRVSYDFIDRTDPANLLNTLSGESWRAADGARTFLTLIVTCCTVVVFVTLLMLMSWWLTLGVLGMLLVTSAVPRLFAARNKRMSRLCVQANTRLSERMVQTLYAIRIIRFFGQEEHEQTLHDQYSEQVRRIFLRIDIMSSMVKPLMDIIYTPIFISALLLASAAGFSLPSQLTMLVILYRVRSPVHEVQSLWVELAGLAGSIDNVVDLLNSADKPCVRSGHLPVRRFERQIEFRDVSFVFEGVSRSAAVPALQGVSLEIRRGEITAIVGPSGAGKSTLISLLFRLYDPLRGTILVDGVPLPELELSGWRQRLAMAGQDAELLSGTVFENISYGNRSADLAAIVAAAKQADAHGFIERLPSGYETRVGERGLRLSGGERQRIGLARALVRRPDILVLDEATNSMDSISERVIQDVLAPLHASITTIVIAHRLSTVDAADHVIVLNQGQVVDRGRPGDLMRRDGHFLRLFESQFTTAGSRVYTDPAVS